MSSKMSRRPEFRLQFGYPRITLHEAGRLEPVAEVGLETAALGPQLAEVAGRVARARGRLVAVLPEAEVWRGTLALEARGPLARRAEARARIAADLGLPASSLAVVLGPEADGGFPAAAVRRRTLDETRIFLRQARLRPAAIVGAGNFPGFAAVPRLDAPAWPEFHVRALGGRPGAFALGTACLALGFVLIGRPVVPPAATGPELAGIPAAAPMPALVPARVALAEAPPPVNPEPRGRHGAPAAAAQSAAVQSARPEPVRAARAAPVLPVLVTEGTRNMPELAGMKLGDDLSATRIAARISQSHDVPDAPRPMLRPAARDASAKEPAAKDAATVSAAAGPRPELRPAAAADRTSELAPGKVAPRPEPRPARAAAASASPKVAARPVRVASLTSTASDAATLGAPGLSGAEPPEPRPAQPVHRAVKPKVVRAAPQPARPNPPTPLTAAAPAPQIVIPVAAVPAQPAPARIAQPAPQAVRAVQPAPQVAAVVPPQPVQSTMARSSGAASGLQPGSYALLGVFGSSDGRHALVRLPSGAVRRVHAGDALQGAQVAAVAADSVVLTGSGRDLVLKLE